MNSKDKADGEGESTLVVSTSAKNSAAAASAETPTTEIERWSDDESEADVGPLPKSSSTDVQSTEANSVDARQSNDVIPTLLPCHCCELILTSLDSYKKHCRQQHYSHSCRFCEKMTSSYGHLKKHLQICHPSAMKNEMRGEGETLEEDSDDEEKSGPNDGDDQVEPPPLVRRSSKKKIRRCGKCDFASGDLVEYGSHMLNAHGDRKYKTNLINCPLCPFMTYTQNHLDYHMNSEHLKHRIYRCDKCEYSGYNLSMLNSHANSHSPIHRYRCAECNFVAKHSNLMKVHVLRTGHKRAPDWNKDGSLPSYLITADVLRRLTNQRKKFGDASGISDELLSQVEKHIRLVANDDQIISSTVDYGSEIDDWYCSAPSVDGSKGTDHLITSASQLQSLKGDSLPPTSLDADHQFSPHAAVNFSSSMLQQQQQQSLNQPFPVQYPQFPMLLAPPQQSANGSLPFNQTIAFGPLQSTLPTSLEQQQQQQQQHQQQQQQQQQEMMIMMMAAQMHQALFFNYPPPNPAMYNLGVPHPSRVVAHQGQTNPWLLLQNGVIHDAMVFASFQTKANSIRSRGNSRRRKPLQYRRTPRKFPDSKSACDLTEANAKVACPLKHTKREAGNVSFSATVQPTTSLLFPAGPLSESPDRHHSGMTTETNRAGIKLSRGTDENRTKEEKLEAEFAEVSLASVNGMRSGGQTLKDGTMKTGIELENPEDLLPRGLKVDDLKIRNFRDSKRSLDCICEDLMTKKLKKEETRTQMKLNQ